MTQKDRAASTDRMIDANLRRAYGDAACDDTPDCFADMLERLRALELGPPPEDGPHGPDDADDD